MMDVSHIPKPKGVSLLAYRHSVSVVVYFTYRGVKFRERVIRRRLPDGDNKKAMKVFEKTLRQDVNEAGRLLATIHDEIARRTFDLARHFPNSKKLDLFVSDNNRPSDITVAGYLRRYLERAKTSTKRVTYNKYALICENQWIPAFGSLKVTELTAGMLRDWIHRKSRTSSHKTISNKIIPLRLALDDAVMDEVIVSNPLRKMRISSVLAGSAKKSDYKPDPFTEDEREQLLASMGGQVRNLFQFAFYSGLRTSELLGLMWEKVDFKARTVLVDQALVDGELGPLKTAGKGVENRKVLLLDKALEALQAQRKHTQLRGRFVFHNPNTGKAWASDAALRRQGWQPAFKCSGVRYRNPYQTRHTYAHILIRQNENLWWIAGQMGHKGIEMLNRHYGGWLEECEDEYRPGGLFTEPAESS